MNAHILYAMRIEIVQIPNAERIDNIRVDRLRSPSPVKEEAFSQVARTREMATLTPSQERRATIEQLQSDALRQLTRARRSVMKHQISLAGRDLEVGLAWLEEKDADSNASILAFVDLAIELASWRLELVKNALDKYGPDTMLIG